MQVMWLGSRQQLQKINITEVTILSSTVAVVNTARDLGVVIDSQLYQCMRTSQRYAGRVTFNCGSYDR